MIEMSLQMDSAPRVLIAGGGVAGLETLLALRELAGDLVTLTLVASEHEFVYRPLGIEQPFNVGRVRRVSLPAAVRGEGAAFVSAGVEDVDTEDKSVGLSTGERLGYDALVLAVGAEALPALDQAITWDDRSDSEVLGGLVRDIEDGYTQSLAVVIPPGPGWPLRAYELALEIRRHAYDMSADLDLTIVQPDPPPLALAGDRAVEMVDAELERAEIAVVTADHARIEREPRLALVLQPSERRLEVKRVLAMPVLRGRAINGIPGDRHRLIDVDAHGRVRGLDFVWAVGDCTALPLKSGGISAQQADVAAEDIAALAGADVEPRSFDLALGGELAGLPAGRFIDQRLATEQPGLAMHLPAEGVSVLTYLEKDLAAGWRGDG
jgi:sulfide:quinone oxidoreductase